ncbi:hypothetical protein [Brachybacterium tyrofermentans]|uniref:hypothetical protein n=1 Tax=Brachybacterium tyrofermentans TaxID=47848 RepID=UPI003F925C58
MTVIPIRRPTGDQLDQNRALWNSSSNNPAVIARQQRAEELTRFQIDHDPTYAAELARLRSYIADYSIPLPADINKETPA